MNRFSCTHVAAAILLLVGNASAQQVTAPSQEPLLSVVVTGSPIIESNQVDAYASFSTRITDTQIKALSALDLTAALRMTPGVQISRYDEVGSYNGNQGGAIYIRGMGASRPGSEIKTYIDDIPVYMGVWNHPLLDLLPVNGMQAIQVHKGPQPQVNGNNFASINLETRRAREDGLHGEGQVSAGSNGTVVTQGHLLGRQTGLDYMLALGHVQSAGHVDNADARLNNAMGHIGLALDEHWSIGAGFLAVSNQAGDPKFTSPAARDDSAAHMFTLSLHHGHGEHRGDIKLYDNRGRNDLANDGVWGNFNTRFHLDGVRWKEDIPLGQDIKLLAGIDHDRVRGDISGPWVGGGAPWTGPSNGSATLPSFQTTSPYLALSGHFDIGQGWSAQPSAGVRHYHASQADNRTAPHAGLTLASSELQIHANYAEGILYPGMETQALSSAIAFMFAADSRSNQLTPSVNRHKELGASLTPDTSTRVDLTLFRDDISNRYVWTAPTGPGSGSFSNSYSDYRLEGAELSVQKNLTGTWKLFGGVTWLKPGIDTLPYAPRSAWTAGLSGTAGPVRLVLDMQHQSGMQALSMDRDASATNQPVAAFTVANMRLSWPLPDFGKKGEAFVSVNNLAGASYEYNPGYPMPGRNARVGLIASF